MINYASNKKAQNGQGNDEKKDGEFQTTYYPQNHRYSLNP